MRRELIILSFVLFSCQIMWQTDDVMHSNADEVEADERTINDVEMWVHCKVRGAGDFDIDFLFSFHLI